MNILIFEYHNFGIEDVKECFKKNGHLYKVVETDLFRNRVSAEFDSIFEQNYDDGIDGKQYDCVFTFNYSPVISKRGIFRILHWYMTVLRYCYTHIL